MSASLWPEVRSLTAEAPPVDPPGPLFFAQGRCAGTGAPLTRRTHFAGCEVVEGSYMDDADSQEAMLTRTVWASDRQRAQSIDKASAYRECRGMIRGTRNWLGVDFDVWHCERGLLAAGQFSKTKAVLEKGEFIAI